MKKLVTFGCSFTDYPQWPTWSDWMAHHYGEDDYEKHARGGVGARAVFNLIVKYLRSKDNFENEHIIVQWGSCARDDKFPKNVSGLTTDQLNYVQCGSITNTHCYTPEYIKNNFSFLQSVFETVNYIYTVKSLFNNLGIQYTMTFMLDPRISSFLGEPGFNSYNQDVSVAEMKLIQPYFDELDKLIDDKFTDKCITMHQLDKVENVFCFNDNVTGLPTREGHPSPSQHYEFFKKYITPHFPDKQFTETPEIVNLVQQWQDYAEIKKGVQDKVELEPKVWPCKKRYSGMNLTEVEFLKYSVVN